MDVRLPTFFVAGAPTTGTTSLHEYLRQHPQVFMSAIKEPTFFAAREMLARRDFRPLIERDRAALRAYVQGPQDQPARYWVSEWEDYVRLFRDVRDHTAIGESSVSYFWLPSAAAAIRERVPDARFIFLLRHPAERLFSWYLMNLERDPRLTFRSWFLAAKDAGGDGGPVIDRYTLPLDGGWCAPHLQRFLDAFPRERMRFYLYDAYRADARAVLRDMFAFLGVRPDHPLDLSRRLNETAAPRFPAVHRLRRRLLGHRSLTGWMPGRLRAAASRWYRRRRDDFTMAPADRQLVIECYGDDIRRTGELIGRDLSAWLQ